MRIWIYGGSPEEVRNMIEKHVGSGDTVTGTSLRAEAGSAFPQSGFVPAISAAIRGELDLLLVPALELSRNSAQASQMAELFQAYGVSVRSASSSGSSSS